MGEVWTKAFGFPPKGHRSHRGSWVRVEPPGDIWDIDLGFPQLLTPLPTPAVFQQPSHVSVVCLSHTHMNTNCRPVGDPPQHHEERLLEIIWSNPSLYRGGVEAQRVEGPFLRSHSTSGAGYGIKPKSLYSPVWCPSVLALSCSLFPAAEPFSLPPSCFLGGRGLREWTFVGPTALGGPC